MVPGHTYILNTLPYTARVRVRKNGVHMEVSQDLNEILRGREDLICAFIVKCPDFFHALINPSEKAKLVYQIRTL